MIVIPSTSYCKLVLKACIMHIGQMVHKPIKNKKCATGNYMVKGKEVNVFSKALEIG